jgi:hypothetical protein
MDLKNSDYVLYIFLKDKMEILKQSAEKDWVKILNCSLEVNDKIQGKNVTLKIEIKDC